ncbi:MAG TPA: hypothetical protein VFZ95_01860 [Steroidobacteraceae bacterium]
MSDPKKPEPDEDLLEFLGGIDEANDESPGGDFADFLANADIDHIADGKPPPKSPPRPPQQDEKPHE